MKCILCAPETGESLIDFKLRFFNSDTYYHNVHNRRQSGTGILEFSPAKAGQDITPANYNFIHGTKSKPSSAGGTRTAYEGSGSHGGTAGDRTRKKSAASHSLAGQFHREEIKLFFFPSLLIVTHFQTSSLLLSLSGALSSITNIAFTPTTNQGALSPSLESSVQQQQAVAGVTTSKSYFSKSARVTIPPNLIPESNQSNLTLEIPSHVEAKVDDLSR